MLIFFAFDNDDMEFSKRRVTFFSVGFSFKMFLLVSKFKMVGKRNTIKRCARSCQKKLTKTYNKGFPNH